MLRQQLSELHGLDAKEANLIDLAADGTLPQAKIKEKLREIAERRKHLTGRLNEAKDDLDTSARLIEACLALLQDPQELYRRCDDEQRKLLNQAVFKGLYIDHDRSPDTNSASRSRPSTRSKPPESRISDKPDPGRPGSDLRDSRRAISRSAMALLLWCLKAY